MQQGWPGLRPSAPIGISSKDPTLAELLKKHGYVSGTLDELQITDNTIVIYTADNDPHFNEWPDGGNTWFRSEKNTNWEGSYRVPGIVCWPARIKAGKVSNQIVSHLDWVPTQVIVGTCSRRSRSSP